MSEQRPAPTDDAIDLLHEEARQRANAVTKGIAQMEDRAQGLIRFNMLVLGLALTGLSIMHQADSLIATGWVSIIFVLGLIGILVSTVLAVSAYLKKGVAAGIDVGSLVSALEYDVSKPQLQAKLLRGYDLAVAKDERAIEKASRKFRASLQSLVVGLIFLTTGTASLLPFGGPI